MTTVSGAGEQVRVALDPGRTGVLRRRSLVTGMVLAPWCYVVTNTAYMWAIRDGGDDLTGEGTLALAAAHPTLMRIALPAVMVGGILIVPAVLGLWRLAPTSRLVLIGGGLMIAGYISYAGIVHTGFYDLAMAETDGHQVLFASVIERAEADLAATWTFLLFVLGNLIGTLVVAIGLWRSGSAPRWSAVAIGLWPVLHVFGLVAMPNEVPQVIGAVLQAAGFGACAVTLHRRGIGTVAGVRRG